jgi:hypothetical protein
VSVMPRLPGNSTPQAPDRRRPARRLLPGEVVHAEDPRERGDNAAGLAPEEMVVDLHLHVQLFVLGGDSSRPTRRTLGV